MSALDVVFIVLLAVFVPAWLYVMFSGALDMTSRQRSQWREIEMQIRAMEGPDV